MLAKQQTFTQTMLDANQLASFEQSIQNFSPLQLAWASGYLAGKSEQSGVVAMPLAAVAPSADLTLLYASQTGNAKGVAKQLADIASAQGIAVNLKNIADFKVKSIKNETHLVIVASTNGEGEPPDDALAFHEFLMSSKAPQLTNLHYSVLALGDSSYEFFCQTGKDFDERLAALGATRVSERVDCDVDYKVAAKAWTAQVVELLQHTLTPPNAAGSASSSALSNAPQQRQYSKENPFAAPLLASQKITGRDSAKDVRHVEIDLSDSGLRYQPGDALGVWFENDPHLVSELLSALPFTGDEQVMVDEQPVTLTTALTAKVEITQTAPKFIEFWAAITGDESLSCLMADKNALRSFASRHQLVDVIAQAVPLTAPVAAQQFVDALRQLTPRLYSIASSQQEVEDEVHLTVGLVNYQVDDKTRFGGASGFLANRLAEGEHVKVFIEHNHNFSLPDNNDTPIIMVGPGTGVAPFRAFMQEREARAAQGDNWLFFGDQTFTQDFLYQLEWQNYVKSGLLNKIDVAFSRDQAEKIYVQDRLHAHAAEVFQWLERGAHLYICGDGERMAKDVHQTLVAIIAEQGQMSTEQAEAYLKSLRSNKRYQKDVY